MTLYVPTAIRTVDGKLYSLKRLHISRRTLVGAVKDSHLELLNLIFPLLLLKETTQIFSSLLDIKRMIKQFQPE